MRSALLLFLLPGLAATDNAICAMLSPLIDGLDDAVPDLSCSCKSAGTASKIGGDAKCALTIGPPEVEGLEDMKITFHVGTTVWPCGTSAMASVKAEISLPNPGTGTEADSAIDTMVSTAVTALNANADMAGEVEYDESTNKITVSLSVEAGKSKEVEVPIQKWGVADFYAKVSLTVAGSMSGLTTTQAVDLCMKVQLTGTEICGADIPKCDDTDAGEGVVKAAQVAICAGASDNWHELFGAPPIAMFPSQEMKFTDACKASTVAAAGESSTNAGAVAGAVISVLLFLGTIATIVYLVKKERIANPLDRLKEKLGKKKVHVMENGANAELATAKPA